MLFPYLAALLTLGRANSRSRAYVQYDVALALAITMTLTACGGGDLVDSSASLPVISISAAASDTLTQPGTVASGGTTDDATPRLSGQLSAPLRDGQRLQVYDGDKALTPLATVNGMQWQFTPSADLSEGEHRFSVAVLGADGAVGPRSTMFVLTVVVPSLSGVVPGQMTRATTTVLTFSGNHFPSSGLTVVPIGDSRASCESPTYLSSTALQVSCTLYALGDRKLELRLDKQLVGEGTVTVGSNVSGITWSSASTFGFGNATVRLGEWISIKVSGTQLLSDPTLVMALDGCTDSPTESGTPSPTERLFSCVLAAGGSAGQRAGSLFADPGSQTILYSWKLPVDVPATVLTKWPATHSGVTSLQCYQAGTSTLAACSNAAAIALSGAGKQDGMLADINAMSYSGVGSYSKEECVKDNLTGLIWEGKTTSGMRAGNNTYTNFGDDRAGDASAYVNSVNSEGLCGFNDWRLPTADELQSLVDYSKATPGPFINSTWFPNTASTYYWSSTPYGGGSRSAWYANFRTGYCDGYDRVGSIALRLVRASQ